MPSLWPFARDDSSPASFEKALQRLSTQITSSTISLEKTRTRAHRSKALWTLWSTLAYLVYTTIIVLVLGPQQWSIPHYAGLAGTPVVVYGVRRALALYYDWRIARQQGQLGRLVKERDHKIAQLKKATRYDSTQELLNKYGGSTPRTQYGEKQGVKRKANTPKPVGQRTGLTPPPTANIPGRCPGASGPLTPARQGVNPGGTPPPPSGAARSSLSSSMHPNTPSADLSPDEPGFAPNAFPTQHHPPSSTYAPDQQHRWYDRILDVMLGEDETLAKNRLALICANCRLVNGQAPPGVRSLQEIGRWRCGSCGAWNGLEKAETEVGRMVEEMKMEKEKDKEKEGGEGGWMEVSRGDEVGLDSPKGGQEEDDDDDGDDDDEDEVETAEAKRDGVMEVAESASGSGSESEEVEQKTEEPVAERVAKTKHVGGGGRRAQK